MGILQSVGVSELMGYGPGLTIVDGSASQAEIGRKAFLALGGVCTNLDTVVEAKTAGAAGNSLKVTTVNDRALAKASLDLATVTVTTIDTVLEAHTAGAAGNNLTVSAVGDAVADAAEFDFGTVCTQLDTVIEFATNGTGGNAWKIHVVPGSGAGEGVNVSEDTVNKILTIMYETAVSTVANVETAIGTTTNFVVGTGGTGANVLAAATDTAYDCQMAGGAEQQYLTVTPSSLVIHFEPTATTIAQVEALITALAGADDIIDVKTPGTGGTAWAAGDAFAATNLASGQDQQNITVAGGVMTIHFEAGATTVANVEALITALAGADDIIDVKTGGTGGNVLTDPADVVTNQSLAAGTDAASIASRQGVGATLTHSGTGEYTLVLDDSFMNCIVGGGALSLGTVSDQKLSLKTWTGSTKTAVFAVWDWSGGAVDDPVLDSGDRVEWFLVMQNKAD